jgi:TolB protein
LAFVLWPRTEEVPRLTNPIQVTSAIGIEAYPTWSPESEMLAYHLDPVDYAGNTDIWVTQPGSGHALNLTADHPGADGFPSYSPDGRQIAFWSSRDGGGYFVMPALGGAPRKILEEPAEFPEATRPQWSSDGKQLAWVVYETARSIAVVVALDTGTSQRVSLPGRSDSRLDLAWSPDGRHFAYREE